MEYALHILILICIFGLLSASLNLVAGYAGMMSLAHAAFFGLGAYTTAILGIRFHAPLLLTLPAAVAVCGTAGALTGCGVMRTRDDTLAIVTFALQIVFFGLCNNLGILTGGPSGLPGIPPAELFGIPLSSHAHFLCLSAALLTAAIWFLKRLTDSGFGRVLRALREDETATETFGKSIFAAKLKAFTISAAIAGVAGSQYALYLSYIDPSSFTVMDSVFVISAVIVGGAGSLWGPLIGMGVLLVVPELLRFVGLPNGLAANLRQIIYGGLLVAFMLWRPQGLLGRYTFDRKRGAP